MIQEVSPQIYKIAIPLPNSPLKALNSYLIKGDGRFLLIDTGMNRQECLDAMTTALKKLDVDTTKTDFFITHVHSDHLGLTGTLKTPTSKVYFSEIEDNP
jgi:glyoxylase-like metal-dependent hydrolase (beta-lactamase superfamily II)